MIKEAIIGRQIIRLETVDSTNEHLKRHAELSDEGTVVIADRQTEGRGRRGRTWIDHPGKSLLFSFLLHPKADQAQLLLNMMWPAVAVAEALAEFGTDTFVKWPNDLLIGGRKVGGVLAETIISGDSARMVIGIGLNLNQTLSDFPQYLTVKAGSVFSQTGQMLGREEALNSILEQLNAFYLSFQQKGAFFVQQKWMQKCCHINKTVTVLTAKEPVQGVFTSIDEQGFALINNQENAHRITNFSHLLLEEELCS